MKYDRSIRYRVTKVPSVGLTFGSIYYRAVFFKWVHFIIHYFFSPGVTQNIFLRVDRFIGYIDNYQKTIKKQSENNQKTTKKQSENNQKTTKKLSENYEKTIQ